MSGEPNTAWVCVDCYQAHHGITEEERGEAYPEGVLSLIPDDADVTPGLVREEHAEGCGAFDDAGEYTGEECECESLTFTWSACRGCGSTLGGERHALTVWVPSS